MKKKLTIALITGFVSLISGLILVGIGFFSGGLNRLEEIAKPNQVQTSYTSLSEIQIKDLPHSVTIKESTDGLFHVSYANSKNNTHNTVEVTEKNGILALSSKNPQLSIQGIMQVLGERLADDTIDIYSVTIEVPTGKQLDRLISNNTYNSYFDSLYIENVHIKEMTVEQGRMLYLNNVQLDSGTVSSYYTNISKSTIKNTTISAQGDNIHFYQTQLENVSVENYGQLDLIEGTLLGDNKFLPHEDRAYTVTNIDLTDQSLADINLQIQNKLDLRSLGEFMGYHYESDEEWETAQSESTLIDESQLNDIGIFTRDQYEKLEVKETEDAFSLTVEKKESKNKLTVEATNATINLRDPK
ncbi:DUF4097 family beta strand repeat-containing protein [Streptococcus suis]